LKRKLIPIVSHPANLDSTAKLLPGARSRPGIYQTCSGFVACVGDGLCLEGYFATYAAAEKAAEGRGRGI
jgi:hypothetical protein